MISKKLGAVLSIDIFFRYLSEELKEEPKNAGHILDLLDESDDFDNPDQINDIVSRTPMPEELNDQILTVTTWWNQKFRELRILREKLSEAVMANALQDTANLKSLEMEVDKLWEDIVHSVDEARAEIRRIRPQLRQILIDNRRRLNSMNEDIRQEIDALLRRRQG